MKIHAPALSRVGDRIRLSAQVETEANAGHVPPELWFEFPAEYEAFIFKGFESFIVGLLPYALSLGENIHIDGPLSPSLAYHIRTTIQVLCHLEPKLFSSIEICHSGFRADPPPRAAGVAMTFSGGVDAYHTFMHHRPGVEPAPGYTLTHGIFVFGFDLVEHQRESYREAAAIYGTQFERLGMKLIPASFNFFEFKPPGSGWIHWFWLIRTHPIGLAALSMALSGGFGRLIMASSQLFNDYGDATGGDFEIQTSLSTEWFEVVHDAPVVDRTEKSIALAEWPETYDTLRVCVWDSKGVQNCGRCMKCVRTMATLEAIGKLERYSTFPKPFRRRRIFQALTGLRGGHYVRSISGLAARNGRLDLALLLFLAYTISEIRGLAKRVVRMFNPDFKSTV